MLYTMQNSFEKMRKADVTADDTAFDGETSGARYTDITKRDVYFFDPATNGIEIVLSGEAADGETFGAEIFLVTTDGWADKVADITGAAGTAWADMTNADCTARLFMDTITISDEFHLKEVTVEYGRWRYIRLRGDDFRLLRILPLQQREIWDSI